MSNGDLQERSSICTLNDDGTVVVHKGNPLHLQHLRATYSVAESNVCEQVIALKRNLRTLHSDNFFHVFLRDICELTNAIFGFVVRRVEHDDADPSKHLPAFGYPGSCMLGRATYLRTADNFSKNGTFPAYGAPCMFMRYDKTFLIPQGYEHRIRNNPNNLPFEPEAYIAVPQFRNGKSFGHFGLIWDKKALAERSLSWGMIEMIMYALEDLVLANSLADDLGGSRPQLDNMPPPDLMASSMFLRPYAKSLSHELRTPMQGVVGMLDLMYETVNEAAAIQNSSSVRKIFSNLKQNIEIVQDSSRRAVEAADNVVQAYDLNLQMPQTPNANKNDDSYFPPIVAPVPTEPRPNILVEGYGLAIGGKRRRETEEGADDPYERPSARIKMSAFSEDGTRYLSPSKRSSSTDSLDILSDFKDSGLDSGTLPTPLANDEVTTPSAFAIRQSNIRETVRYSVHEALQSGGRPEHIKTTETELGQHLVVDSPSSDDVHSEKIIEWTVNPLVPHSIPIERSELSKVLYVLFHNAFKFTDFPGQVNIDISLSPYSKFLVVRVKDSGRGIPENFRPRLFRAFSQQDGSRTRQKEGLGLGLLVARANARKMGGEIRLVHTEDKGPYQGSEFEVQLPFHPLPYSRNADHESSPHMSSAIRQQHHDLLEDRRSQSASPRSAVMVTPPPHAPPRTVRLQTPPKSTYDGSISSNGTLPTRKLSILIAEDNAINRKILVALLKRLGHTSILTANDGRDAVKIMASLPPTKSIDIVLMDLWMPHMDGYEATQQILAMPRWRGSLTIMAVSADVTAEALERAANVGMEGYMTKPYKIHDLEKLLNAYVASKPVVAS